jgi:beta-lactamase class A
MNRPLPFLACFAAFAVSAFPAPMPAPIPADLPASVDPGLQAAVEAIDSRLRAELGFGDAPSAAGVLDLRTGRLALVQPDRIFYGASLPKVAILLGWYARHPDPAATDAATRHELGLVIKQSSNELAAKYSQLLGLGFIRAELDRHRLYDPARGGGLWLGKHYGLDGERVTDPVGGHSHAANARQLLRFYLLLEGDRLVSPAASAAMRADFASPDIPHKDDRFVAGLAGRGLELRRKAGWWEDWHHDSAAVTGPGRHYLIVALTRHARGEDYLRRFAAAVDDVLAPQPRPSPAPGT